MLSPASLKHLEGVHPDLVKVAHEADIRCTADGLEFQITEGLRTMARQRELLAKGSSSTMKSRHLDGHAYDFVPIVAGEACFKWPGFWPIIEHIEAAAKDLGIAIECGGRWRRFPDGPHVQIPWGK